MNNRNTTMARLRSLRIFLMFFDAIIGISATTHWVVTENGRIQSQLDSVFQMRRPYDLPAFLEQENRLNAIVELHKKIVARKVIIDEQITVLNSITNVESWLHSSNPDCISSHMELEEFDFYTSVATDGSWRKGVTQNDYLLDGIPSEGKKKVPDCKKTFPLDFSVYTFEHLSAMRNRKNLTQHQEKGLIKHLPPGTDLTKFGHQIAHGLLRNSTSWLHLNLAAIYWRVKGDAYNALECARRAIVTAPREFRDIPLLTTGGILHAAKYSAEAAIVLHTSIDHAPTQSHQHLALGHVYAVLGDYNRSIACYDNSLRLAPTMDQARQAKQVILCHQRLDKSLVALHKTLDDVVTELHAYQDDYEDLLKLREKILCDHSMKVLLAKLGAERLGAFLAAKGQTCMQREGEDAGLSCQIATESEMLAHSLQIDIGVSLQQLQNVEIQVEKINDRMSNSEVFQRKTERPVGSKKASSDERGPEFFTVFMEPTSRPKYHNLEIKKSKASFESKGWPEESECSEQSSILSDTKQYMPVHLPPENKGFATHLFVSELIGIDPDKEHSLPWYPPTCQVPETYDQRNMPPLLLMAASKSGNTPESSLTPFIANLVKGAELAEIGQRILTATKAKVAAPWVLSVLASLHWRIIGKPRNALDCLQQALNAVPTKFRDVPLVGIASIGQKLGFVNEALRTAKEALRTNSAEPTTNFLFATLLHAKGNDTGAIYHLKQALRVDPDVMDGSALKLLRTLTCEKRLSTRQSGHDDEVEVLETSGLTCLSPEMISKHDLHEGETVLCVEDGEDCRPVQCFAMKMNVDPSTAP